jgi:uncharacterized protein YecE (DUF72 family)
MFTLLILVREMARTGNLQVGTSGWNYEHWRGVFCESSITQDEWLEYYSHRFPTVEINNSFYQLPQRRTLQKWKRTVDESFTFAVKASRYITHMKKLRESESAARKFIKRVDMLNGHVGPILFQLPPKWRCNAQRLEEFLESLPEDHRYAFEFRDHSWWCDEVYELLRLHHAAFCIFDLGGETSPTEVTVDYVYVRLHGPSEKPYQGRYGAQRLSGWAGAFSRWLAQGRDVYCYFDNDQHGYAAQDAMRLQQMLAD